MWMAWVILALVLGTMCGGIGGGIYCAVCVIACVFLPFIGLAHILDYLYGYNMPKEYYEDQQKLLDNLNRMEEEIKEKEKEKDELFTKPLGLQEDYYNDRYLKAMDMNKEIKELWNQYYKKKADYPQDMKDLEKQYLGNRYESVKKRRGY